MDTVNIMHSEGLGDLLVKIMPSYGYLVSWLQISFLSYEKILM